MSLLSFKILEGDIMGLYCKGICEDFKGLSMPNFLRYKSGQKRCTVCSLFLDVDDIRCPCCGAVLRTKTRNRQKSDVILK